MKRAAVLALSIIFLSTFALAENPDISVDVEPDTVHPGESFELLYEVEDDETVDVTEYTYIGGYEADEYSTSVTSGTQEAEMPYAGDEEFGEHADYYSTWAIVSEAEDYDSSASASWTVEPRITLEDISSSSQTLPIVINEDLDFHQSISDHLNEELEDVEVYDHQDSPSTDYDEIVVIGAPNNNEAVDEFADNVGEVYSMNQYSESDTSNLALLEVDEGMILFLSGNSEEAVERSVEIFTDLAEGEINHYFEDEVSTTVTEEQYELMISGDGSFEVEVTEEPEVSEGENIVFGIRGINTHPTEVRGELTINHVIGDKQRTESDNFSLDAGDDETDELDTQWDFEPGYNEIELVFDPEDHEREVITREYQIGEPEIGVSTDIINAVEGEALEMETEVENLQSFDYSGTIQFEHYVEDESKGSQEAQFEIEADTIRSETDTISTAEPGENTVEVTVYDSENQEVTSTSETVEVGKASPGVSIEGDLNEDRLRVVSNIERVDEFEDAEVEMFYLKDGYTVGDHSPSVSGHGDEYVEETPVDELRPELAAETGDSSLGGQHEFTIDILQDGEVVGSDEDTLTYEENRELDVLRPGWTMISGDIGLTELEAYCSITEFQGEKVWQITGDEWSHPEDLESHLGYYVYIEERCEAPLTESSELEVGEEAGLEEGWNMISTYTERSFNNLNTDCEPVEDNNGDSIWIYNSIANSWDTGDKSDDLEPGRGYFINVESDCSIEFGAVDSPPTPTGNFFGGER